MLEYRYIQKLGEKISPLGFGVLRLPMQGNSFPPLVYNLIDKAISMGINYFDTGWTYQQGKAESLVGEAIVKRYGRDRFKFCCKMPVWEITSIDDMERVFNAQLNNLGVDYFDFYFLHCMTEARWDAMHSIRVESFLDKKKKQGKIKHVGFSFHDTPEVLKKMITAYNWDVVQLQINYLDWYIRDAKKLYEIVENNGLPCMVMEPAGGGRLSQLPEDMEKILKNVHPDWTPSAWAMRFVNSLPNVAVTLSGMNTMEQLSDNVETFSNIRELTKEECDAIEKVTTIMRKREKIPCSGCGYCMRVCPKHIAIPNLMRSYNEASIAQDPELFYGRWTGELAGGVRSDACLNCGACKRECPQKIDIPKFMGKINDFILQKETNNMSANNDFCDSNVKEFKSCRRPFRDVYIKNGGAVTLCSWNHIVIGNLQTNSLHEIWNGSEAKRIRRAFLQGERLGCNENHCPLCMNEDITTNVTKEELEELNNQLPNNPTEICIAHDERCNHICPSCRHEFMVPSNEYLSNMKTIADNLEPYLSDVTMLDANGGGEFFVSKELVEMLSRFTPSDPDNFILRLESNGVLFKDNWSKIAHLGKWMNVAITPNSFERETYRYLAGKDDLAKLEESLEFISKLRLAGEIKSIELTMVVQDSNFREIPSFLHKALDKYHADRVILRPIFMFFGITEDEHLYKNVLNPCHPYHQEYLEVIKDPICSDPRVYNWGFLENQEAVPFPTLAMAREYKELKKVAEAECSTAAPNSICKNEEMDLLFNDDLFEVWSLDKRIENGKAFVTGQVRVKESRLVRAREITRVFTIISPHKPIGTVALSFANDALVNCYGWVQREGAGYIYVSEDIIENTYATFMAVWSC